MGGLWTFWHYFVYFIILTSVLTKLEHWRKLLDITIFVGVLSAFYGFAQKTNIDFFLGSGGRDRIFGTLGNPALFAGYELFIVFMSLIMLLRYIGTSKKHDLLFVTVTSIIVLVSAVSGSVLWYTFSVGGIVGFTLYAFYKKNLSILYLLAFYVTSTATLMTAVRGSVLGYAVGLTVFAFLWMRYKKSRIGKLVFNTLISSAVLFVIFASLFSGSSFVKNSRYLSRITDLSIGSVTVQTRFWAWQAGLKGWSESPKTVFLGWGPENFNTPFSKYFNPKFFVGTGSETLFDRAHNMFIEILVTMGIVGFLAYINIFAALFSSLRRLSKNSDFAVYGMGFISAIIAYIIHNSFIFDTSANLIVFFTITGFISWLSLNNTNLQIEKNATNVKKPNKILTNSATIALIIFVPWLIYKTNILPAKANYATTRAIVRGWASDFKGALAKYKESLSYAVPGKYEYRHRFAQYLVGGGGPSSKEKAVR
ncbi:MAG: O-antigen ligase family protein, partial [bacterium]|nr:O-antigen ligase family protein [bacterium]